MNHGRGDHQSWKDGPTHHPSKGIPGRLIKPIEKSIPSMIYQVSGSSIIEPWIKLMDDGLESNDTEQTTANRNDTNKDQDESLEDGLFT